MNGPLPDWTRRLGAMSLVGISVVFAATAFQVITLEDPNAPTVVASDPIFPAVNTTTAAPTKELKEVSGIDVQVLGTTATRVAVDGVVLGDWALQRNGQTTRFILSETTRGTVVTIVLQSGSSTEYPLSELTSDDGRLFTFARDRTGETFGLGNDGSLSLGDEDGVWATIPSND